MKTLTFQMFVSNKKTYLTLVKTFLTILFLVCATQIQAQTPPTITFNGTGTLTRVDVVTTLMQYGGIFTEYHAIITGYDEIFNAPDSSSGVFRGMYILSVESYSIQSIGNWAFYDC